VDVEELTGSYPRLFHMAAAGSWPSIATHGLLPTQDIVASFGLTGPSAPRSSPSRVPGRSRSTIPNWEP